MDLSGDQMMLARLGIHPAEPFDWGDEPRMSFNGVDARGDPGAPLSGLDSLKKFVQADGDGDDDGADDERKILQSLFRKARADLAKPVPKPADRPEQPLTDDVTRDVPIKGLSDRAVAELTVESRTSLFGSILRLFDMPKDRDKNNTDGGVKKKSVGVAMKDAAGGTKHGSGVGAAVPIPAAAAAVVYPMIMNEPILSTAEIVRSVHLTARMGDVPPGMDSKEYAMAALHFLASYVPHLHEAEYRSQFDGTSREGWDQLRSTLPVLPLIRATNPGDSLEVRRYGRARPRVEPGRRERRDPDSMDRDESFRRRVLNLERVYSSSLPFSSPSTASRPLDPTPPSPSKTAKHQRDGDDLPFAFQRYVPRRKLLPHIEGGAKEELTLMISGHMQQPQHTPGPKPKTTKPKTAVAGSDANASSPAKSASGTAKSTKPMADRAKGAAGSILMPVKRKADKIADGLLHVSKRGSEFSI